YLTELTELRDRLKSGLSSTAHEPDGDKGPGVSELADRIKALKAAHSVEATPQRARQKHSTAEEPITTRIRRRQEANTGDGQPPAAARPKATTNPAFDSSSPIGDPLHGCHKPLDGPTAIHEEMRS